MSVISKGKNMNYKKLNIWSEPPNAYISVYVDDEMYGDEPRVMIVCPGGGNEFFCVREAESLAKKYFAEGKDVFLLNTTVPPDAENYLPVSELTDVVSHIRENKEKFCISNNFVPITGFLVGDQFGFDIIENTNENKEEA